MAWVDDVILEAQAERQEGFTKPLIITADEALRLEVLREVVRAAEALCDGLDAGPPTQAHLEALKKAVGRYRGES